MNPIQTEGRPIGEGAPAFLIAEMSANHDRDLDQALALVDVAAEAGFDAVKLQTYSADSLTVPSRHESTRIDPVWGEETLYDLYCQAAMPMEFHAPLFERAKSRGILAFSSIYDPMDLRFMEDLGNPIYKISSFELLHLPLLAAVAETGKPIILSTGMASLGEVEEALNVLQANTAGPVLLLHCCSSYPAPAEAVNLAAIQTLKEAFGLPVGFSDHTIGSHIPLAAVMAGACAIEKHFTNDTGRAGPDHRFSATPDILARIGAQVREAEAAMGDGRKHLQPCEAENRAAGRRSIFTSRDIAAGEELTPENVRIVRPGAGLHPRHWPEVIGARAKRPLAAGVPLGRDDLA